MKNTLTDFALAICFFVSLLTIGISDTMLRTHDGDSLSFYPFLVIAAVAYAHWFAWYAFVPLKRIPEAERKALQARMNASYNQGALGKSIWLGYLFVFGYGVEWFQVSKDSPTHFYNPLWLGVAFIAFGVLAKLHGLLRYLLLERK